MPDITIKRQKAIFLDLDGCLVKHQGNLPNVMFKEPELLPGVLEKFNEWDAKCYKIILTTGRRESMRELTEKQLSKLGLFWDVLICGIGSGQRVLVNDMKPDSDESMAIAFNLKRNVGLGEVDV